MPLNATYVGSSLGFGAEVCLILRLLAVVVVC